MKGFVLTVDSEGRLRLWKCAVEGRYLLNDEFFIPKTSRGEPASPPQLQRTSPSDEPKLARAARH
ncbi:MAG TPA: hypothetical protein VFX97_16765 [Pyrinomonadaceae bacterium]|nr:hypothetical protein [Pyrinomonadaceae bacterium]